MQSSETSQVNGMAYADAALTTLIDRRGRYGKCSGSTRISSTWCSVDATRSTAIGTQRRVSTSGSAWRSMPSTFICAGRPNIWRFDRNSEAVNAEYDVRDNDLHVLIIWALQAGGVVSKNRRRQHAAERERIPTFRFMRNVPEF